MTSKDNNAKLAGALLLGAAIGSILGILFAPSKGSKIRSKLLGKSNALTDEMNKKVQEYVEKFKNETENIKEKANHFMKNGLGEIV